jgi:NifU-like protein involved in Fe-S cluster formation
LKYTELTLHYFETAPLAGELGGPGTFRGAAGSRDHGAWVQFDVRAGAGIIETARFLAFGCPHTIAVSAWVAEHAAGRNLKAELPESVLDLSERFAVPEEKKGRLLIIEDAWMAAVGRAMAGER